MIRYYLMDLKHQEAPALLDALTAEFAKEHPENILSVNRDKDEGFAWVKATGDIKSEAIVDTATREQHAKVMADCCGEKWSVGSDG